MLEDDVRALRREVAALRGTLAIHLAPAKVPYPEAELPDDLICEVCGEKIESDRYTCPHCGINFHRACLEEKWCPSCGTEVTS